jgi:hypothetical protein
VDAIQVNAVLLRGILPDLRLTPGATLMGRVLERHAQHGLLNLAGAVLVAQLPDDVEAGARLRLAVQDVTPDHVVLRVVGEASAAAAPPAPPPAQGPASTALPLPLPGGGQPHVQAVADESAGGTAAGGVKAVTVRYESPALGRLEVRLALGASGLVAGVGAGAGDPVTLAGAHAGELRTALARVTGVSVDVHVGLRRDRVDFRA